MEIIETYYTYDTPIGNIMIASDGESLTALKFRIPEQGNMTYKADRITDEAAKQLEEYFAGQRREFKLPINAKGTDFQRNVWKALLKIPYGETRSYKQIAQMTGNEKASRAVGMANNKNPISIIIPCHRVIGTNGKLIGYGGGMEAKQKLLQLERK